MNRKRTSDGLSHKQYQEVTKKIEAFLCKEIENFTKDKNIQSFLQECPFPDNHKGLLSDDKRIYYLLLNRLKNWVAREQAKQDGGSSWKRKFKKNPDRPCAYCEKNFDDKDEIVFHHELRDGREPIPMHKKCHDEYHLAKKNSQ